jgi:hypothetical protein
MTKTRVLALASIVSLLVAASCFAIHWYYSQGPSVRQKLARTEAELRTKLDGANLKGASPSKVASFLKREGFGDSQYEVDAYSPEYDRTIVTRMTDVANAWVRGAPFSYDIRIVFQFDEDDRLTGYRIEPVAVGL